MAEVADAGGTKLESAVKVVVYLSDINDFDKMNTIYCKLFSPPRPTRTTIGAGLHGLLVEADTIVAIHA